MARNEAKQSYNFKLSGKINDSSSIANCRKAKHERAFPRPPRGRRAGVAAERRVIVAAIKERWADRRRGGRGGSGGSRRYLNKHLATITAITAQPAADTAYGAHNKRLRPHRQQPHSHTLARRVFGESSSARGSKKRTAAACKPPATNCHSRSRYIIAIRYACFHGNTELALVPHKYFFLYVCNCYDLVPNSPDHFHYSN